ncbi:hypothetical protein WA158_002388 [Blastocystis sp. Blastoise]
MSTLSWSIKCPPYCSFISAIATKAQFTFQIKELENDIPVLTAGEEEVKGDIEIAKYFVSHAKDQSLLGGENAAEVDTILAMTINPGTLHKINEDLATRTYLVGFGITLADIYVWSCIKAKELVLGDDLIHVNRWFSLVSSNASIKQAQGRVASGIRSAQKNNTPDAELAKKAREALTKKDDNKVASKNEETSSLGAMPDLPGAVMGHVMTRFPPEASGFLHIGHVKAAMLNAFYAKRYNGKLLVRFDDTNPSKEKQEFEDSIIEDLASLDIRPDVVSHTSDFFPIIFEKARQLIVEGKAFMDNTDQETMRKERMERVNSKNRDLSVEENLRLFDELCKGTPEYQEYCLRAKIDMQSPNGTLRDPVIVRYFPLTHLRTGDKYKAYPCYDLACPIVDSIEGVTHAMRTTEYKDRDEQYMWFQKAMHLREVTIVEFARMNFQYTLMSKRKLTWLVDHGEVEGWDDPRFPTVKGVLRRGIQLEALRNFILSQGFSKRIVTMEWDKFWSDNKKILEKIAKRYMGIIKDNHVELHLTNMPAEPTTISVPLHPKDTSFGNKDIFIGNTILLEPEDAAELEEGEEITLMRWANMIIKKINKNEEGTIISIEGEYHPEGDFRTTKHKLSWVCKTDKLQDVKLIEYDYLLTKKTLEEDDDFLDFLTSNDHPTKVVTEALVNAAMKGIKVNDVIQLERRGFYRCDKEATETSPAELILIPDGKQKAMSKLSSALGHK